MAVFRVEKNSGYTVMSNHHLRNRALSLKAKGLLSQMLSLPEDWDYTLQGLARINRESIDAIRQAIRELEQAGYIWRSRERDEKGRLRGADYVIFELPQPVPASVSPTLENPTLENPTQENPTLENPMQLNPELPRILRQGRELEKFCSAQQRPGSVGTRQGRAGNGADRVYPVPQTTLQSFGHGAGSHHCFAGGTEHFAGTDRLLQRGCDLCAGLPPAAQPRPIQLAGTAQAG